MGSKRHLLSLLHHGIVGLFLLLKGIDKVAHHAIIGGLVLLFGLIVLLFSALEFLNICVNVHLSLLVDIFEAVALLLTSYLFFLDGKEYIQYVTFVAALGFIVVMFVRFFKRKA